MIVDPRGIDPREPTDTQPGTRERLSVYAARADAGLPTDHPGDVNPQSDAVADPTWFYESFADEDDD